MTPLSNLRLLLLAPDAQSRKTARQSSVGQRFIEMRFKIIKNSIFHCVAKAEEMASRSSPVRYSTQQRRISSGTSASTPPAIPRDIMFPHLWTQKDFVTRSDSTLHGMKS